MLYAIPLPVIQVHFSKGTLKKELKLGKSAKYILKRAQNMFILFRGPVEKELKDLTIMSCQMIDEKL